MFCPECGEVMGTGPLDPRCAGSCERRGMLLRMGRRIGALFGRFPAPRQVPHGAGARRRAGGA